MTTKVNRMGVSQDVGNKFYFHIYSGIDLGWGGGDGADGCGVFTRTGVGVTLVVLVLRKDGFYSSRVI